MNSKWQGGRDYGYIDGVSFAKNERHVQRST